MQIMSFTDTASIGFSTSRNRYSTKLYYKLHIFHLAFVFCAGSNDVDSGSVYATMTEDISKLSDILFNAIKGTCKQVA